MSQNEAITVVGLTGGIACGKSTALAKFSQLGWSVISADSLTREILSFDNEVRIEIKQRWGENIIKGCGSVDKSAIARIIFTKDSERKWIEDLLHPIIRSKWISFVQSCPSQKCMIELPLLFENNLQSHFTCTVSIFAPTSMILNRLHSRGLSKDEANSRMRSQLTPFEKVELADFVLWSGGSIGFLDDQINGLDHKLSKLNTT